MLFFKDTTTLGEAGLLKGSSDFHCHILPGVDDGIQQLDQTLKVLDYYEQVGITHVWCTPHTIEDLPDNTPEHLRQEFQKLQEAYQGPIRLHLGSEFMMEHGFMERLTARQILPMGTDKDLLLVETRTCNPPHNLEEIFAAIQSAGFFPMLAHPERYTYMSETDYERWKQLGVKFQLNIPSLAGIYGPAEKSKAEWLLKNDMYDLYGSDLHNSRHTADGKPPYSCYTLRKKLVPHLADLIQKADAEND